MAILPSNGSAQIREDMPDLIIDRAPDRSFLTRATGDAPETPAPLGAVDRELRCHEPARPDAESVPTSTTRPWRQSRTGSNAGPLTIRRKGWPIPTGPGPSDVEERIESAFTKPAVRLRRCWNKALAQGEKHFVVKALSLRSVARRCRPSSAPSPTVAARVRWR